MSEKNVYRTLMQGDMIERLAIDDDHYGATICVGTFTFAHAGPEAFNELVRITRPGGIVCFTIRDGAYQNYDYRGEMLRMETGDCWELQELREQAYLSHEKVTAKFCTDKIRSNSCPAINGTFRPQPAFSRFGKPRRSAATLVVSNSLRSWPEPKSTISG